MRSGSFILALVVMTACGQYHVTLRGPTASASPAERVDAFMRMRPVQTGTLTQKGEVINRTLFLADKTEVVSPEDLEPLVGTQSETMDHARESVRYRHRARIAMWTGVVVIATGIVLSGFGQDSGPPFGLESRWVGVGVAAGGGLIAGLAGRYYARRELHWRNQSFSTYARDLGTRLNVCAHGMQVVACEEPIENGPPETPPPPKEPATNLPDRTALHMR